MSVTKQGLRAPNHKIRRDVLDSLVPLLPRAELYPMEAPGKGELISSVPIYPISGNLWLSENCEKELQPISFHLLAKFTHSNSIRL